MEKATRQKPAKITNSTPAVNRKMFKFPTHNLEISRITSKKKPILDLIIESIKAVGLPKKGASYQAITKYVLAHQEVKSGALKLAILKGIEKGQLARPKKTTAKGVQGSFCLPIEKKLKKVKPSKIDENGSPTESAKTNPSKIVKKSKAGANKKSPKTAVQNQLLAEAARKSLTKATKTLQTRVARKFPSVVVKKAQTKTKKKNNSKIVKSPPQKAVQVPSKAKRLSETEVEEKELSTSSPKNKEKGRPKKVAKDASSKIPKASEIAQSKGKDEVLKEPKKQNKKGAGTSKLAKETKIDEKELSTSSPKNKEKVQHKKVAKDTSSKIPEASEIAQSKGNNEELKEPKKQNKKGAGTSKLKDNIEVEMKENDSKTKNRTARGKKLSTRTFVDRKDLSDTEVDIKKKLIKTLKSCSSDTELEMSKRVEAKEKKRHLNKKERSKI